MNPSSLSGKANPSLAWGMLTDFRYYAGGPEKIGLVVQWKSYAAAKEALSLAKSQAIIVPPIYSGGADERNRRNLQQVWSISGPAEQLISFLVKAMELLERVDLAAAIQPRLRSTLADKASTAIGVTLVGLLDDGFAFANTRFVRPDGSMRCLWLWNQDASSSGEPTDGLSGPSRNTKFGYGGQWSGTRLQDQLNLSNGSAETAYRDLGFGNLRRSVTHGTHIADLLAGNRPGEPSAIDDCELVFVQFPKSGVEDPSGGWLERYALDGLNYVLEAAGPNTKTVVVNISWGPQIGPHDGLSPLEVAFDQAIKDQRAVGRELIISMPSGNSFNARAHAAVDCDTGGTVDWIVPPDGRTPAHLEIWWPSTVMLAEAVIHVETPTGDHFLIDQATPFSKIFDRFDVVKDLLGNSPFIKLAVHPTADDPISRGLHGRWKLGIEPTTTPVTGEIHVYLARADHNMGAKRLAKASHFTDRALEDARFTSPSRRFEEAPGSAVRRRGTLNGMGTGLSPYLAGGYSLDDLRPAPYASSGATRGIRTQPDFSCLTDRSLATPGVRASGVRTGTRQLLVGTSTAAPQLARKVVAKNWGCLVDPPSYDPKRHGTGLMVAERWVVSRK